MTPLISIVMAAKNYARFLPQAIESVFAQTYANWELIVVDDGSTDATASLVRPFLRNQRVRYVRSDKLGQSRAKNLGINFSRGPFVAFLDADDAWLPTKLEKQLALFHERPEVGVVFCRRALMDEGGILLPPRDESPAPALPRGWVLPRVFSYNFVCFSSCIVRREVFAHVGRFDPQWDLAIDYDLWLRVATHYAFDYVDEDLVLYRTGHGNLSKKLSDRVDTALSMMDRAVSRYGAANAVPRETIAAAYASTYRTIAYVMRPSEPLTSAKWYAKALAQPANRLATLKGLAAAGLAWLRGKRASGSDENASVNA